MLINDKLSREVSGQTLVACRLNWHQADRFIRININRLLVVVNFLAEHSTGKVTMGLELLPQFLQRQWSELPPNAPPVFLV